MGNRRLILLTAAAVALLAVTMGSRSVFGLFLSPLNSATGLGIATISFAVAVSQLTWGAAQPFCGMLAGGISVEQGVPRAMVVIGGILLFLGVLGAMRSGPPRPPAPPQGRTQ